MNTSSRISPIMIVLFVACMVLLILLSRLTVIGELNLLIQEAFSGAQNDGQSEFVLVQSAPEPEQLQPLLENIAQSGANRVFWVLPDAPLSAQMVKLIEQYQLHTIKVPQREFSPTGNVIEVDTSQWSPSAGYLIAIPHSTDGARRLPIVSGTQDLALPSPVAALHPSVLDDVQVRFLNFTRLALNTPVVNAELSAFDEVLSRITAGKDVFLVPGLDLMDADVRLPHHEGAVGWHPVQYHALALAAWESGHVVQNYPLWMRILVVVMIILSLYLLFLWAVPKLKRVMIVVLVFFYLLFSLVLSMQLGFISPSVEMFSAMILFFVMVESFFNQARHARLTWVDHLLTRGLAKRLTNSKQTQSFWNNVADLVTQNLQLDRSIFLELPQGAHHLSEISAMNCKLEDINELRRDCRREPYISAIQSKQAVESNRPYFKDKSEECIEILAPFFKGTKVLGFWALSTSEKEPEKLQQLKEQVNWFALQISALLDAQHTAVAGEHRASKVIRRYGCEENEALQTIGNRLTGLLSNVNASASFFESMSTPGVLFDVFGQVALVNDAMYQLGHKESIELEHATAYDFLTNLLPVRGEPLRNIIRQLTTELNAQSQRFQINLGGVDYLLVLSCVQREMESVGEQEVKHKLQGLMCEFLSLKDIQDYLEIERGLYNNYVIKIKNYLSTLQMGLLQVERKAEEPLIKELGLYMNLELQKASDITRRTHYFMKRVTDRRHVNAIPFNPVQILQSLVTQSEQNKSEYIGWRDVQFNLRLPTFASLGLGAPELYKKLVFAGLKLLADDAVSPKQVTIVAKHIVRDDLEVLYIKLTSEGYGLPNDQLQKLYEQSAASTERSLLSEFLVQLRGAKDVGMECRLKSRVGKGYRLSILIEGIGLHDD